MYIRKVLTVKSKYITTCFAIVTLFTVGSILGTAPSLEQQIEQTIIIRHWELVTILEGPDLIYIMCEPLIESEEQLQAYKTARLDLLHNISNTMNPEDEIGAVVTFNSPISFNEAATLATKYEFNFTYYEYIASPGSQGGISILTGETLEEREAQMKQVLGSDFEIIGITMISGNIPVKLLLEFQNEPIVFLVDIGPPEIYNERGKGKLVGSTIPNLYFVLAKSLPATTILPLTTILYTTYLVSTTKAPSMPLITTLTTPIANTDTPQSEVQVDEFRSTGSLVILGLMITLIGFLFLRSRIRRYLPK